MDWKFFALGNYALILNEFWLEILILGENIIGIY
jgi:hypothetical protein